DIFVESLEVEKPDVRIVVFPDGTNNIPGPKIKRENSKTVFEQFVAISARHFTMQNGTFEYDNRKVPINLKGDQLKINFGWERDGPRYRGNVSAKPFRIDWPKIAPLVFDADVTVAMEKTRLVIERAAITQGKTRIDASGTLDDYRSPKLDIDANGRIAMAEYVKLLRLPLSPEGIAEYKGKFTYADGWYELNGSLTGSGLAVREPQWTVTG